MARSTGRSGWWVLLGVLLQWAAGARAQGTLEGASPSLAASPLPIVYEALRIEVDQQHAHVVVEQHFKNESGERLEGRYLFRTGEGARVNGLRYWNGEQEIVGEVFEREIATQVYEEVTGIGRDPALFEQVGEGTFSFRIFPIEPGEVKRVEVRYDLWLPAHGDTVELSTKVTSPRTTVQVDVVDPRGFENVSSPTHELRVSAQDAKHVALHTERAKGEPGHFTLRYAPKQKALSLHAAVHRDTGHDAYLLLHLSTPAHAQREQVVPKDVTVVIDHSGSMAGEPLTHACAAARQIVHSLDARDRVNLVVFDDRAEAMYSLPRALTAEVRADVTRRIEHLASGGGTDIALALKTALAAQDQDERPNVVLFMTDGQSDAKAALAEAAADVHDTRVFTIGLGTGVEKPLLSRLAANKRGRFVFIADLTTIESEVARLYRQIAAPLVTDLRFALEGGQVMDVYPRTLPDLFVDDELRIAARVLVGASAPPVLTARLHGKLGGRAVSFDTRVDVATPTTRRWVGQAWAQARVEDLLEEIALHGENEELKNEVVDLALAYNFVTPYTSFLAIPASELTDAAKDTLGAAREAKRRIREAHPDAVALSRDAMPPGDPVISVRAPANARQVTARFPFGLTLELAWDVLTERWLSRFLVPKDVPDGVYEVEVWIVGADGSLERATTSYTIDSEAQPFTLDVRSVPGGLLLRVLSDEEPREVRAALRGDPRGRALLEPGAKPGCAFGFMAAEPGRHLLRVVLTDEARNERIVQQAVEVPQQDAVLSWSDAELCP